MDWSGWVYTVSTVALFAVFVFIILRYYGAGKKVKEETEKPKYRMLDDDDDREDRK